MDSLTVLLAQVPPSDTFYSKSPHWGWLIAIYFFLGGISGGAAFIAALLDVFGNRADQGMSRLGYVISIVALALCAPLLIVDLTQPQRFWHMLWQTEAGAPMFKWWSPMSFGVWIITFFGIVLFLSTVGSLAEAGKLPRGLSVLSEGPLGNAVAILTGIGGLFLAGYTGAILTGTNRPLWADTRMLGLLFLLSGISAAASLMLLLGHRHADRATLGWLGRMDFWTMLFELVVLAVMLFTLGAVATRVLGNGWGLALLVGTVLLGLLLPILAYWKPRLLGAATIPVAAVLVLAGSFILRSVIMLASEAS